MNDPVLASLGLDEHVAHAAEPLLGEGRALARVTNEDRLGYRLESARGELRGVLPGRVRRAAAHGDGLRPAVGDWVIVEDRPGVDAVQVLDVVPRRNKLSRKAPGRDAVEQVVGANIDVALLVTSMDLDLNPRRIERYRALCEDGGVRLVIVLTKADLLGDGEDRARCLARVAAAAPGVRVHVTSVVTGEGLAELDSILLPASTVALLGSSGVGKSTLANRWIEQEQAVGEVDDLGRGRHTTTSRSIFRTRSGALLMDSPGMRELALWDANDGVRATFPDVEAIAARCHFRDCGHRAEPGCALVEALASGELSRDRFASWTKLRGELAEIERRRAVRSAATEKRSVRALSRALRSRLKEKGR